MLSNKNFKFSSQDMLKKKRMINFYKLCYPTKCNSTSLPKELQLILINNGSLTQNLNSIIGQQIKIHLIEQRSKSSREIFRKVWIQKNLQKLAFAESCWKQDGIDITNIIKNRPIGQSIILSETDIYKEIQHIEYGYYSHLEAIFEIKTPLWHRKCTIWHNKKKLTTIEEFFSIYLRKN